MNNSKTYKVTAPSSKVFELQLLPKHFFLYYGQLPQFLTAQAASGFENVEDVVKNMTPEQQIETAIFVREAVKFACVNPKISLTPKDDGSEISPFEISEEDFEFLSQTVMRNIGEKKS